MSKILKAVLPEKCLGCEMCVYEAQRQMNKLGPEGSFIRIFKENGRFSIVLDPQVNTLDVEKIKNICPQDLYEVLDVENYDLLE